MLIRKNSLVLPAAILAALAIVVGTVVAARPAEANRFYQRLLQRYFTFLIPPGQRVLEIGCSLGDLLAAVKPARGVGVDFSEIGRAHV